MLVSETKIDISFSSGQFIIPGFAPPYWFDRNSKGVGLLLYLREDIPSKIIFIFKFPVEGFVIEVNLCRKKLLLGCFYNPHKTYISDFEVLDLITATIFVTQTKTGTMAKHVPQEQMVGIRSYPSRELFSPLFRVCHVSVI